MSTINHVRFVLFSFSGRINRASWWLALLIVFVATGIGMSILQPDLWDLDKEQPPLNSAVNVFILLLAVPSFAITIKRLNDRNWSHYVFWLVVIVSLPYYIAPFFGWFVDDPFQWSKVEYVAWVPSLLVTVWLLIDNGFLRGTEGPNRYGPDPLQRTSD